MPADDFFERPKPRSALKHAVLSKYLHPWLSILGRRHKRLWVVDGFAGAGEYDDGTPGSPLLAAKWIDHALAKGRRVDLRVIAVESEPKNVARLEAARSPWGHSVQVRPGQFAVHLPAILNEVRDDPTLWFLDPFGMKGVEISTLRPLLDAPPARHEMLVRLDHVWVSRFGGWLVDRPRSEKHQRLANRFAASLAELIDDPAALASLAGDEHEAADRTLQIVSLYMTRCLAAFDYVQMLPIYDAPSRAPAYYLLFATRHPLAVVTMTDIWCRLDNQAWVHEQRGQLDAQGQGSLLPITEAERPKPVDPAQLESHVLAVLSLHGAVRGESLWAEVQMRLTVPVSSTLIRKAAESLIARGRAKRDPETGRADQCTYFAVPASGTG